MAEILGLVSGAITVAQIAGQVGASVLRLKTLWSEVKDVPESINTLMLQLELLDAVLSEMENQFPQFQAIVQTDRIALLSLEHARKALQNLEGLVDDLHQQISSTKRLKKGIAKVKVTLKRDLIRTYQERLQNTLQLLSLSQQSHLIALSRIQTSLLVSGFQTLRAVGRNDHQSSGTSPALNHDCSKPSMKQTHISQSVTSGINAKVLPWKNTSLFWKFAYQIAEISVSPDGTSKIYQARLHIPTWLLPRVWDLQAYKSYSGWKISLKPWAIRSYDSEVFRHALQGSTSELLRLLRSNDASLYDRNPDGWTLLHYAAFNGKLEIFQTLIEFGLSIQETDASGITPLYHICRLKDDSENILDVYRYLSSQAVLDEVIDDVFLPQHRATRQSSLYRFVWKNSELLDFIVTHFHPAFYRLPASCRFKSIDWMYVDPKGLLKILTRNQVVSPTLFLAQIHDSVESSLHELARTYFRKCLESLDINGILTDRDHFNHWRELVRWMFVGISPDDTCRTRHDSWEYVTPLFAGLLGCDPMLSEGPPRPKHARRRLSAALHIWLEDLLQAGVNLKTYGEKEWALYRQDDWLQKWRWRNLTIDHDDSASNEEGVMLASFEYGSRPENWAFQWESAAEEYAGDFWESLESQLKRSARMPGDWTEE